MSAETIRMIGEFDALPLEEKQAFVREVFRRLPSYDSGTLDDEVAAEAGDQMTALLEREENCAQAR